ncbi:LYR motif-containing protein 4B [Cocos nucifera]|nr:LYR motif-containing protein 4B [Cocos nucifera]
MAASSPFRPTLRRRLLLSTYTAASTTSSLIVRRCLHEGPDTVEELLERHLVKNSPRDDEEDEFAARRRLTSTRREALGLYRDILRATRFFTWPDARGIPWRDVLRENARREFEEARFERDPEVVTRLLIGGRDAVQKALDKLVEASKTAMAEAEDQRRGGR